MASVASVMAPLFAAARISKRSSRHHLQLGRTSSDQLGPTRTVKPINMIDLTDRPGAGGPAGRFDLLIAKKGMRFIFAHSIVLKLAISGPAELK